MRKVRLGTGPDSKGELAGKTPPEPAVLAAETPMRFFCGNVQNEPYLIIPEVSGEGCLCVPIGFMRPDVIASDPVATAEKAALHDFGALQPGVRMAWMRAAGGRMKSGCRYTPQLVYSNFPWPDPDPE